MYLAPIINNAFVDRYGKPFSGGQIETYLSGTLTPRIAFKDALGVEPHDWPITLNSMGEPPAPVFFDEGPYRIIRKDASGVQIGAPIDGVQGIVGEGSVQFTPEVMGYTTPGVQSYGPRTGRATIRGSRAWYEIYILMSAKDPATAGPIRLGNLSPLKSAGFYGPAFVAGWKFNIPGYSSVGAYFLPNSSEIQLIKNSSGLPNTNLVAADLLADSEIMLAGWVELAP